MVILSEERVSSSSTFATPQYKYEVFLSFRGKDTRMKFTDHLYYALKQKGIHTFRDDEGLEKGKLISELFKVIEESRVAVIVFSKNYANSTWCLDELAKIVECMEKTGITVLPIFYLVEPNDVRHQRGTFAKAFAEELPRKSKIRSVEKEQTWRVALKKVGNLNGWPIAEDSHEAEIIHQIVKKICLKLHDIIPRATEGLVGIDDQVKELNSLLCIGLNDVRVIGIWGMGGIGKTTLAEVVFNIHSIDFEGCSFIKISKESDLVQLQQQLLNEILKEENMHIWNVKSGVAKIEKRLRGKKILLVLDDVNHLNQLKSLAKKRDWFGSGSRIIITTRNQHLLNAHKVDEIYKCKELNDHYALKLLCLKAFDKERPKEGYEEISQKIVDYTNGLPLALDVLGSLLVGRDINHWKDVLKRLKRYPEADILNILEISYDGLSNEAEQRMFIYIACFLKGMNRSLVIDILDSFDCFPTSGMDVLIDRSLITISKDNIVWVHDLLQEMGWEILRKLSPAKLGERRGLRLRKDICDVLTKNEGTNSIKIINQEPSVEEVENCTCGPKAFANMSELRFLRIQNVYFPKGIEYLSNELRILQWSGYPLKYFPSSFQPEQIFKLDMRCSKIEKLWEGAKPFPNLRSIDLSYSENLIKTPDLTETPRLEELDLHGCTNLVEGHSSILVHKRLRYLNLAGCISLENLPTKIEMESLQTLILSNCSKVRRVPNFGQNMKCLVELYLDGTAIEEIPLSIKHLTGIKNVVFSRCLNLWKSPEKLRSLENFCHLEKLDLSWCNLLEIPNSIGCLMSLKNLNLEGNNFVTLPASIGQLSKLKSLILNNCKWLQSLLELPSFSERPSRDACLPYISMKNCTKLETLPHFLQISELDKWDKRLCWLHLNFEGYTHKLNENYNDVAIVKRHLQGPYDRNVPFFTITFGRKIPQWFTHQSMGNYVSVELPPNWCDSTWLGFVLCASFSLSDYPNRDFSRLVEIIVSVFATTLLPGLQCICPPKELVLSFELDSRAIWYVPKDKKAFELFKHMDCNQCGGHITFYFDVECKALPVVNQQVDIHVECGVRLVNKQDVEEYREFSIPAPCFNCPKLIENENDISVAILKHHLQRPDGCQIPFLTNNYARGDEIPQWFTHQNIGNSVAIDKMCHTISCQDVILEWFTRRNTVTVKLPPNWCDSTWMGFALYTNFNAVEDDPFDPKKSKNEYPQGREVATLIYVNVCVNFQRSFPSQSVFFKSPAYSQLIWYVPKDEVFRRFEHITVFHFSVTSYDTFDSKIKMKCGVRVVYKQDVEESMLSQPSPDRLVWIHCKATKILKFTSEQVRVYELICKSKLHVVSKDFLWCICHGRLDSNFTVAITRCPLCNDDMEDELHLYYKCAFSRSAWSGNSWGFRLEDIPFPIQSVSEWVSFFLSPPSGFLPEAIDEEAFALFATMAMFSVWSMYDKCYKDGKVTPLEKVPSIVAKEFDKVTNNRYLRN